MAISQHEHPQCACLRSKGMYIEVKPDPTVPNTSDGFFWCSHTQTCLGSDGKVAGPDECQPGRECFQSS